MISIIVLIALTVTVVVLLGASYIQWRHEENDRWRGGLP